MFRIYLASFLLLLSTTPVFSAPEGLPTLLTGRFSRSQRFAVTKNSDALTIIQTKDSVLPTSFTLAEELEAGLLSRTRHGVSFASSASVWQERQTEEGLRSACGAREDYVTDIVIVGTRPAGLMVALELVRMQKLRGQYTSDLSIMIVDSGESKHQTAHLEVLSMDVLSLLYRYHTRVFLRVIGEAVPYSDSVVIVKEDGQMDMGICKAWDRVSDMQGMPEAVVTPVSLKRRQMEFLLREILGDSVPILVGNKVKSVLRSSGSAYPLHLQLQSGRTVNARYVVTADKAFGKLLKESLVADSSLVSYGGHAFLVGGASHNAFNDLSSDLNDAFNIAWKLAILATNNAVAPLALARSYDTERNTRVGTGRQIREHMKVDTAVCVTSSLELGPGYQENAVVLDPHTDTYPFKAGFRAPYLLSSKSPMGLAGSVSAVIGGETSEATFLKWSDGFPVSLVSIRGFSSGAVCGVWVRPDLIVGLTLCEARVPSLSLFQQIALLTRKMAPFVGSTLKIPLEKP